MEVSAATLEAAHAIALNAALAEVVTAFHDAGIRPRLIKGPVVASWLYDDPAERPYGDLDLLVDPELFGAAEATLARLGFHDIGAGLRAGEREENAHTWLRVGERAVFVDLHRSLLLIPGSAAQAWALISRDGGVVTVAGTRIDIPSPAAHLVILALHAAQHGVQEPKPLTDLTRAIGRVDLAGWHAAGSLASKLGVPGAMREGMALVPGGRELAARLALADDAPRWVRIRARGASEITWGLERMISAHGMRSRLGMIASRLVPSPAAMRFWKPLAARGSLGLTLAYLWRPAWLAAKLPRALSIWIGTALPAGRRARIRPSLAGAWWTLRAWLRCRAQLRRGDLAAISLPAPPLEQPGAQTGIHRTLARLPASCLERALIRQRWHAAQGRPRDVVIGVRGPVSDFAAHAWLDGDPDSGEFQELRRRPPTALD